MRCCCRHGICSARSEMLRLPGLVLVLGHHATHTRASCAPWPPPGHSPGAGPRPLHLFPLPLAACARQGGICPLSSAWLGGHAHLWRCGPRAHTLPPLELCKQLIGEVVQSRRRPLLGHRHNYHKGRGAIRHYANHTTRPL